MLSSRACQDGEHSSSSSLGVPAGVSWSGRSFFLGPLCSQGLKQRADSPTLHVTWVSCCTSNRGLILPGAQCCSPGTPAQRCSGMGQHLSPVKEPPGAATPLPASICVSIPRSAMGFPSPFDCLFFFPFSSPLGSLNRDFQKKMQYSVSVSGPCCS